MKKEDVLENWTYYSRCLKLLELKGRVVKKDIYKFTNDTSTNKNLIELLKFLEENSFLVVDRERVPFYYKIDKNKLANLLRESSFFRRFGLIIQITKSIYVY